MSAIHEVASIAQEVSPLGYLESPCVSCSDVILCGGNETQDCCGRPALLVFNGERKTSMHKERALSYERNVFLYVS